MTFTEKEQKACREAFIEEARKKAWGAACHADYISKQLDELLAEYTKLKAEDGTLEADIKELEAAVDCHTVDNRNKRKALQEKRNTLGKVMQAALVSHQQGEQTMARLIASVEDNLALAKHAEKWQWKEVQPAPGDSDAVVAS